MFTRRTVRALLSAAAILILMWPISVFSDSHVRFVRLSYVEGDVQIDRNTGNGFEKAILNLPVTQGVRLETGADGRVEVEFENGSTLRLLENSQVSFDELSLQDSGTLIDLVRIGEGTAYVNYLRKGSQEFTLAFADQRIRLDHAVHFRVSVDSRRAEFAVFGGELPVSNDREIAWVRKGESLTIDLSGPSKFALAKEITPEITDGWDSERVRYEAAYNQTASANNPSPYQYGWNDLSYYGSWSTVPGYGSLWRPFGVSPFWDPFDYGAWAYYPGYGYTFVSSYPWGWTPYRFGSWVWVGNYGWCWHPGHFNGWQPVPVVVNPPAYWARPVSPTTPPTAGTTIVRNVPVNSFGPRPNPNVRAPLVVTQDSIERIAQPNNHGAVSAATGAWVTQANSMSIPASSLAPEARPVSSQPWHPTMVSGIAPVGSGVSRTPHATGLSPASGGRSYSSSHSATGSMSGSGMHSPGSTGAHSSGSSSMHSSSGMHGGGKSK